MTLINNLTSSLISNVISSLFGEEEQEGINNPLDIPDVSYWGDCGDTSSTNIIESGDNVSQLSDKSLNNNEHTQGTGINQPKTNTFTLNGLNVIRFDGDNDFLEKVGYNITSSLTVQMLVSIIEVTTVFDSIFSMDDTNDFQLHSNDVSEFLFEASIVGASNPSGSVDLADSVFRLLTVKFDFAANTVKLFINNVLIASVNDYNTALSASQTSAIATNRLQDQKIKMDLAELVIVNRATTDQEDIDLFDYFQNRWKFLFDVLAISNLILWLNMPDTSTITESGNNVSQIDDNSPIGNDFTQSLSPRRPETNVRQFNNLNVIDFTSAFNDNLDRVNVTVSSSITIHIVAAIDSVDNDTGSLISLDNESGGEDFQIDGGPTGGEFRFQFRSTGLGVSNFNTGVNFADSVARLYSIKLNSATNKVELFVNNVLQASVTSYTTDINSTMQISLGASRAGSTFLDCAIGEVVIVDRATSAQEDIDFFNYVRVRFAL